MREHGAGWPDFGIAVLDFISQHPGKAAVFGCVLIFAIIVFFRLMIKYYGIKETYAQAQYHAAMAECLKEVRQQQLPLNEKRNDSENQLSQEDRHE